jgi:hypothetical protein
VAELSVGYLSALVRVAPAKDLIGAALRRLRPSRRSRLPQRHEIARALVAFKQAPRLFSSDDLLPLYRTHFPAALARFRQRAERILEGEAEIFGVWQRPDPRHADPKLAWEAARSGHLVELAAAARLHPRLAPHAHAFIQLQIEDAPEDLPPLEVAIRALHRVAALELTGGAGEGLLPRLARSLLMEGDFLSRNLEDGGVCPANHLLGDWLGLLICGLWTGNRSWTMRAMAGVRAQAARQVESDGAHFEASTAYHRFALELLWIAHRLGGGLGGVLRRMLDFLRGYLLPDGCEPGFGDGDDARLLPLVPRAPRDHSYLVGLGAALLGESRLGDMPEEVLWWGGWRGVSAWQAAPPSVSAPAASFPRGGVHVLRSPGLCVALRAGPYGQNGVGGHAHNDQLSLVVHADGKPLIIDPRTGSYTADPVARDRFRGTAAHATVTVGGEEQSPFFEGRPFALPDRARTGPVTVEDLGRVASLAAEHGGYQRLGVRHRRRVTLLRELEVLLVEDELGGHGCVPIAVRFPVAGEARPAGARTQQRVEWLAGRAGTLSLDGAVELDHAALVPLAGNPLRPRVDDGWHAPYFGRIFQAGVVTLDGLLSLPGAVAVAVLLLP